MTETVASLAAVPAARSHAIFDMNLLLLFTCAEAPIAR